MFQDAPEARDQDREARPAARKDVGAKQMLVERMQKIGRGSGKKQAKSAAKKGQAGENEKGSDSKVAGGRRGSSAAERVAERRRARESQAAS